MGTHQGNKERKTCQKSLNGNPEAPRDNKNRLTFVFRAVDHPSIQHADTLTGA